MIPPALLCPLMATASKRFQLRATNHQVMKTAFHFDKPYPSDTPIYFPWCSGLGIVGGIVKLWRPIHSEPESLFFFYAGVHYLEQKSKDSVRGCCTKVKNVFLTNLHKFLHQDWAGSLQLALIGCRRNSPDHNWTSAGLTLESIFYWLSGMNILIIVAIWAITVE